MKHIVTTLTFLAICQPSLLLANPGQNTQPLPHTQAKDAKPTADEHVAGNKKEWVLNVEQTLPGLLCDSKKYFVNCFSVTQGECTEFTQLLVRACLNNIQMAIPQVLDPQQGEYWGQMVGKCSYDLYEKFMQSKKLTKPGCESHPADKNDLPKPSQATP